MEVNRLAEQAGQHAHPARCSDHSRYTLANRLMLTLLSHLRQYHEETYHHSLRVSYLVRRMAKHLICENREVRRLIRSAMLHDVGKLAIPIGVLDKPARLNAQEWIQMDRHGTIGASILHATGLFGDDEIYIVSHHHRWFGQNARMTEPRLVDAMVDLLAVCDAYDAIIYDRPYRDAQNSDWAIRQINERAGDQFNPVMADLLRCVLSEQA